MKVETDDDTVTPSLAVGGVQSKKSAGLSSFFCLTLLYLSNLGSGSSLDGSFVNGGVDQATLLRTMEPITDEIPQPNFDESTQTVKESSDLLVILPFTRVSNKTYRFIG